MCIELLSPVCAKKWHLCVVKQYDEEHVVSPKPAGSSTGSQVIQRQSNELGQTEIPF